MDELDFIRRLNKEEGLQNTAFLMPTVEDSKERVVEVFKFMAILQNLYPVKVLRAK